MIGVLRGIVIAGLFAYLGYMIYPTYVRVFIKRPEDKKGKREVW